jgi:ABC-type branched-subunit amino acid transport system ATPase component
MTNVLDLFPRLKERLDQVVGSMSGGEQQMCAIARALMSRPAMLLLDELSLGLAPLLVEEIMSKLIAVAAEGTGVLLVEQDAGYALEIAQRAYVLKREDRAGSGRGPRRRSPGSGGLLEHVTVSLWRVRHSIGRLLNAVAQEPSFARCRG